MSVEFTSYKGNVLAQLERAKAAALEALGTEYTHHAIAEMDALIYHAPLPPSAGPGYVRTGRLRGGQGHQANPQNSEVVVGNDVEYSPHVHFPGITRNWSGRPWMTNTLNNRQAQLQAVVVEVFKRMMK